MSFGFFVYSLGQLVEWRRESQNIDKRNLTHFMLRQDKGITNNKVRFEIGVENRFKKTHFDYMRKNQAPCSYAFIPPSNKQKNRIKKINNAQ